MGFRGRMRESLDSLLKGYGYRIIQDQNLYEWQKISSGPRPKCRTSKLPEGAAGYLVTSNSRLRELQARYAVFDDAVTTPLVWKDTYVGSEDVLYFRGDNGYVWQTRRMGMNLMAYALTAYYAKSIDRLGLLGKLEEDDYFGVHSLAIDNRIVSRDLLDSVFEIHFLDKHLNISSRANLSILDIGAGYGRLAHRMISSLPNVARYFCADAFPISTFISEYYLRFRNLEGKARIILLDEIEHVMRDNTVDVAVNIHSFSECRIPAIEWWLSLLQKCKVRNLMIVPNFPELRTNDGIDFGGIVEKYGYKMIAKDPKYSDPAVREYAINNSYYYLFELTQNGFA